jgi:hypothetical protein
MKLNSSVLSIIFSTLVLADEQPFAIVTRSNLSHSWVGGSAGCFGTEGPLTAADITECYQATVFDGYNCSGNQFGPFMCDEVFESPIDAKSIRLEFIC